jgi:hypothetical protein
MPAWSSLGAARTPSKSGPTVEEQARCYADAGLPTRSRVRAGRPWWPAPPGSADSPRSDSHGPDEGPTRPCQQEWLVVQTIGGRRSTSVAPDPDAIAARSLAGQRTALVELPTIAGSIQRAPLGPPGGGSGWRFRHPQASLRNNRQERALPSVSSAPSVLVEQEAHFQTLAGASVSAIMRYQLAQHPVGSASTG